MPCYHHQALRRLGRGVEAVGWADDGTVEAAVVAGSPVRRGVQWHPEERRRPPAVPGAGRPRPAVRGAVSPGAPGSATLINPATEQVVDVVPHTSAEATDAAIARARAALAGMAGGGARRPGPAAAPRSPRRWTPTGAPGGAGGGQLRAHDRQRPLGGRQRPRRARTTTRPRRSACSAGRSRCPAASTSRSAEPIGVVGVIVPWNFPMPIAGVGVRAGPGRRQHGRAQARRADAADRAAPRPSWRRRGRPARGRVPGACRARAPSSASGSSTTRTCGKIVFTGSTEVGRRIMAGCAAQVKRVTLELGGKSANIVFADADLERAAATAPVRRCSTTPARTAAPGPGSWWSAAAFDRFMELLEARGRPGPGRRPRRRGDRDGPADLGRAPRPGGVVRAGRAPRWRSGASAPDGPGFWFPPTVLTPVDPADPVVTEEVFGPVVAVVPFDDEADAVRMANDTPYGLSGSIWTENVGRALRVARGVESGNLSVNSHSSVRYWTPFGGVQAVGPRPGAGPRRAGRLHRDQERVHRHRSAR